MSKMNNSDQKNQFEVIGAAQRYLDAYRVARTIITFGSTIKIAGIVLGGLFGLISLSAFGADGFGKALGFVGFFGAVIVGFLVFLLGIMISAQGQILLATLDTAVNSSVFLTPRDKAEAMSLLISSGRLEQSPAGTPPPVTNAATLLIGAWRDEEGTTTFNEDGTETSEFYAGCKENGRWSVNKNVLTVVVTERDGKTIDSVSLRFCIAEIDAASFRMQQVGDAGSEWRASRA